MDISIIIPCYNVAPYIKNLLLSLHMLNLNNIQYEIIFILDDCTDNTGQIIKEYIINMNYKIIHCDVHSPGMARNLGLNAASGEYIWFIDSDDWIINPEVLQQTLKLLKQEQEKIVQIKFVSNFFNMEHYSMVWQYIFLKDFLNDIRFNNKQNHEDDDFMKQVYKKYNSDNFLYLNIPSYFYNYNRPNSQTRKLRESLQEKSSDKI